MPSPTGRFRTLLVVCKKTPCAPGCCCWRCGGRRPPSRARCAWPRTRTTPSSGADACRRATNAHHQKASSSSSCAARATSGSPRTFWISCGTSRTAPGRRVPTVVDVALDRGADDGLRGLQHARAARPLHASHYWTGAGELRRHSAAPGPARRLEILVRRRLDLCGNQPVSYVTTRPPRVRCLKFDFHTGLGPAPGGEGSPSPVGCLGQPDALPQPSESGPSMERARQSL